MANKMILKFKLTIVTLTVFAIACTDSNNSTEMGLLDKFKKKPKITHKELESRYDISDSNRDDLIEIEAGNINLPTGKIIVGDPFFTWDITPFSRTVKPGTYPVKIYIKEIESEHFRIAFAKIKFESKRASNWILAVTDSMKMEDLINLKEGEFFGFGVDAGLACFIDQETNEIYGNMSDEFYKKNPDGNYYDDILAKEFKEYSGNSKYSAYLGDWNNHIVDSNRNLNTIIFSSGWGDGYYPTYWGRDENNQTVELTIDFLIDLDEEDEE